MYHVYLLRSKINPKKTYVGYTTDLQERLQSHNDGKSLHTAEFRPWELISYISFDTKMKAIKFEKYLKIGSGHSFARRYFW